MSANSTTAPASGAQGAPSPEEVLRRIPHGPPFRFVDRILALDDEHVLATAHFPAEADFYRGHFPDHPITPGVILLEAMAQAGVVAHALYFAWKEGGQGAWENCLPAFTEASVQFETPVPPGSSVRVEARPLLRRLGTLRSRAEMHFPDGTRICHGVLSGMGVKG